MTNDDSPHLYDYRLNERGEVYAIRENRIIAVGVDPAAPAQEHVRMVRSREAEFAERADRWFNEAIGNATRDQLLIKEQVAPDSAMKSWTQVNSWVAHTSEGNAAPGPVFFGNRYFLPDASDFTFRQTPDGSWEAPWPSSHTVSAEFKIPDTPETRDILFGTPEERLAQLDAKYQPILRRKGPRAGGTTAMVNEYTRKRQAILDEIAERDKAEISRHEMAARLTKRNWFGEFRANQSD